MKHLVSAVMVAAVLAIAAPGWAQTPMTPASPLNTPGTTAKPPPSGPTPPAAAAPDTVMSETARPEAAKPQAAKPLARRMPVRHPGEPWSDRVADQLNRAEVARAYAPPLPPPPYPPRGYYPPPPWAYPAPWGYPYPSPGWYPRPWGY